MYWIKLRSQRFPIREGETTLGRSRYCSVVVPSAEASREHAAIQFSSGTLTLTDLDSSNGTLLNKRRLKGSCPLKSGDRITIGDVQLQVVESQTIPDDGSHTTQQSISLDGTETPTLAALPGTDESE